MLSSEKYPIDPSCSSDDESPNDKLKAVGLSTSDLKKEPKFSIRDYVFVTRNKDLSNNWPFSQNNLRLCVKHGVKDLLPPFQSPGLLRNPLHVKRNVESALVDKENICNSSGKPFDLSNSEFVKSNKSGSDLNIFVDSSSINTSVSEANIELGSTTTTISSLNIHLLPTDKNSCLDFKAKTLKKPSEVSAVVTPTASQNRETTKQSSVKKCRLVLKYSNIPRSSTKEASTLKAPMSSEAMAVCPVCRTFSSSSNTTLNAHIDQCLSGEYTAKSVADSRVDRHRIKPRKTRLMADIYKTALHYTLEDLDRRNGSNWASNRTFSAPVVDISADQQGLCLDVKETTGDGSVYVDSNGTKLRILSKFGNPTTDSKTVYTPVPRELLKGSKGSMSLSAKKVKSHKCSRQATHGKKIHASRFRCSPEISNGQDGVISQEEVDDTDECTMEQHKSSDQVKLSETETRKGWVCSKKTGLMKKTKSTDDKWHSARKCTDVNLLAKRGLSLSSLHVKKLGDLKFSNAISSGKNGRNDNSSHKVHDESNMGNPYLRKRLGSSLESEFHNKRKSSLVSHELSEPRVNDMRKNGSPNHKETGPSPGKRPVEIKESCMRNADNSVANPKLSSSHHVSKAKNFSSLRKKFSSASHASAHDSNISAKRKFSVVKKSKNFSASKPDEEEALSHSEMDQSQDFLHEISEENSRWGDTTSSEESFDTSAVLKVRSSEESMISKEEEAVALKSSQSTSMHSHHEPDAWNENASLLPDNVARHTSESIYSSRTDNLEQLSELPVGGQFMRFSNSVDPGFLGLPGLTGAHRNSQKFMEEYKLPLYEADIALNSTEPVLTSGQDILGANLIPENTRIGNVCEMAGLDCSAGGGNYMHEVDQIPIPGPPGSFLPSPRHMVSDDLQGNSTLTSSRVQSLEDRQESADQSSESPASVTSTVSNSNIPISGSELLRNLSVGGPPAKDVEISGSTISANNDVETCLPKTKLNNAWMEIPSLDCMTNVTVSDNRPFGCRNNHPCCCSGKEGLLQNVDLSYHDSPLLQTRTMGSILGSSCQTQMSCGVNGTWDSPKSSSNLRRPVQGDDGTKSVEGPVSSSVYNDNEVHFRATADRESISPAPTTPVIRLMGKNLIVDPKLQSDVKHSMSNSLIGHANLQEVSGRVYTGNVHNEEIHRVPHMNSRDSYFFQLDGRLSNGLRNFEQPYTPHATSVTTLATLMDQRAAGDFTGSSMHHEYTTGLPTQRFPTNTTGNLPSSMHHETGPTASTGMSNSLSLCSDLCSETQQYVYGRPVMSLVDTSVLVPPNNELVKWNYTTLGTSDVLHHASLNTGSSPGARFRPENPMKFYLA